MTLRWWLLSLLSSVVAISSLHLWRHRDRPRPVPVVESEAEDVDVVLPAPRLVQERPSVQRPIRKPPATGMATVRGRVLGVQETGEDTEEELTVVISDEQNEFEADVEPDGSFTIELAPGTYRFHAQLQDMNATLDAVTVGAEEERELLLQLAPCATITGTLRPPSPRDGDDPGGNDLDARFEIRLSGPGEWSESEAATVQDNQFTVTGLDAGKRYDLRLSVDGFRPVELTGIAAPSDGLLVNLVRLARLRGGFGIARGERCPIHEVSITVDNNEESQVVFMDHFCRFDSSDLPSAQRARVQVSEEDWQFDVLVDIPPHGDPPFLCLRSQCREPTADELSTLEISLVDSPDRFFAVYLAYDQTNIRTSAARGEIAQISEIPSGISATVNAFSRSCRPVDQTLVLAPGGNRLTMFCQKP
jgi:hypothetical protein